jgi:hypothetical protein
MSAHRAAATVAAASSASPAVAPSAAAPPSATAKAALAAPTLFYLSYSAWYWIVAFTTVLFVGLYVVLFKIIVGDAFKVPAHARDSGSAYTNSLNRVGFWIHAITGSLYCISSLA